MTKVLACIDGSTYATSICDHAAWYAARAGGSVRVLHVIDRSETTRARIDLSGSVGLGARDSLLEELAQADEIQGRLAQEHGRALLDGAAARLKENGVENVELFHRHGEVAETVHEFEATADIVVIGKRGESGNFAPGHLGSKVERVVRGSVRPILAVPRKYIPFSRLVVAFDGGDSSRAALERVVADPAFNELEVLVVMAGVESSETNRHMDWARGVLTPRARSHVELRAGEAETVIMTALRDGAGDLLVMGAYGHSRIRELLVGSTTTAMLRQSRVPVLLFR